MPSYLHPGVYVEEVPSAVKVIEGAGTSTAAFIGIAYRGPTDEALRITSWSQFQTHYGSFLADSDLAYAVFGFFSNGGTACYVVRVNRGDASFAKTKLLKVNGDSSMELRAVSPGGWGNSLKIGITDGNNDPEHEFSLAVFEGDSEQPVELHADLSMNDSSSNYALKLINQASNFIYIENDSGGEDFASFTSANDISAGVNLDKVYNILLKIDEVEKTVDLRNEGGGNSSVGPEQIKEKINAEFMGSFSKEVASIVSSGGKQFIKIKSPSSGPDSNIQVLPPADADATAEVLGLMEYSWEFKGGNADESLLEVRGEVALGSISPTILASDDFNIQIDGATPIAVTFADADPLETIIAKIITAMTTENAALNDLVSTDGEYLIIRSTTHRKISITGTAKDKLLGTVANLYSYNISGAADTAATVLSDDINNLSMFDIAVDRKLRLQFDHFPIVDIDLSLVPDKASGSTVADIQDAIVTFINDQVKAATGIKKKLATKDGDNKFILTSPSKGVDSSITFYHPRGQYGQPVTSGDDITTVIFPVLPTPAATFLAEDFTKVRASVEGNIDLAGVNLADLQNSKLRFSASGLGDNDIYSIMFELPTATGISGIYELLRDLGDVVNSARDIYRLVYTDAVVNLHMFSMDRGKDARLRFSIPLTANGIHDSNIINTKDLLIAASSDTSKWGNPVPVTTDYQYDFKVGVRRPKTNYIDDEDLSGLTALQGGLHNVTVTVSDIFGVHKIADRDGAPVSAGIHLLDAVDEVSILSIPCVKPKAAGVDHNSLISSAMAHCDKRKDRFFIADVPATVTNPEAAKKYVLDDLTASKGRDYSAIYYPWIKMTDPIGKLSNTRLVPVSGHIAGLYARIDARRGVWKAPAGLDSGLAQSNSLNYKVTDIDQDILNPIGLNCIRQFPGAGIVSWGARTLGVKTAPEWKYVPIRRTAIMLRKSIYNGIQWAVFEPNDEPLWSSLRLNIGAFMNGLFRAGAFQGQKVSDAYFVRCGLGVTMTQADIDRGQVIVEVGFAPLKPAEFVIVRIEQIVGQQS